MSSQELLRQSIQYILEYRRWKVGFNNITETLKKKGYPMKILEIARKTSDITPQSPQLSDNLPICGRDIGENEKNW